MGKAARMKHKTARARSRLDELTFGTFNVRTAAVNDVNGISHIDTLLRPCAARGCNVVGLQETKRDGTSEFVTSGYRVYFSRDCSGVKGERATWGRTGNKGGHSLKRLARTASPSSASAHIYFRLNQVPLRSW